MDDSLAIRRLKQGDIASLGVLIERYQIRALRTAYLITQDTNLAQDVVQDAFLNAYRSIHQFDLQRPFAPWFMRSVVNGALKAERRRSTVTSLESAMTDEGDDSEVLADPTSMPDEVFEAEQNAQMIWEAIAALTPDRRAVLVLRLYLDMNEAETAEMLGIPVGTVKSRLHAAKQRVRDLISAALTMQEK